MNSKKKIEKKKNKLTIAIENAEKKTFANATFRLISFIWLL